MLVSKYSYNYQVIDGEVCRTSGMHETGERGIQNIGRRTGKKDDHFEHPNLCRKKTLKVILKK
jgi:hypothetical protein